jgi:WhiB family redox-sensing transcriptional regulator
MNNANAQSRHAQPAPLTPCTADPDRWTTSGDDPELKQACRGCPRRWQCARDAITTPAAEGMWSGVYLPEQGRGRVTALRQLQALAAHAGYATQPAFEISHRRTPPAPTTTPDHFPSRPCRGRNV